MLQIRRRSNAQPPDHHLDAHPTEPPRPAGPGLKHHAYVSRKKFKKKKKKDVRIFLNGTLWINMTLLNLKRILFEFLFDNMSILLDQSV